MKLRLLLAGTLLSLQAFAQVDLINKIKDNGADAPLGYEWETIVDPSQSYQYLRAGALFGGILF